MICYKVCVNYTGINYSLAVLNKQYRLTYELNKPTIAPIGGICVFKDLQSIRAIPYLQADMNLTYFECKCVDRVSTKKYRYNGKILFEENSLYQPAYGSWPKGTRLFKKVIPIRQLTFEQVWS